MTLWNAEEGTEYTVRAVETEDREMNAFLFSLGCYPGEPITVVSRKKKNCIITLKHTRYLVSRPLAEAILL